MLQNARCACHRCAERSSLGRDQTLGGQWSTLCRRGGTARAQDRELKIRLQFEAVRIRCRNKPCWNMLKHQFESNFFNAEQNHLKHGDLSTFMVSNRFVGTSFEQSSAVDLSSPQVGQWDQDAVLLTVQMISTVQIFAGARGSGMGSSE